MNAIGYILVFAAVVTMVAWVISLVLAASRKADEKRRLEQHAKHASRQPWDSKTGIR